MRTSVPRPAAAPHQRRLVPRLLLAFLGSLSLLSVSCDTSISSPEPFPQISAAAVPGDSMYSEQWALPLLSAQEAWGILESPEFSGQVQTAVVAVLDTMIDLDHPDLQGNIRVADGWDIVNDRGFVATDNPGNQDVVHGTHVAGIIAAVQNNSEGVAGIGRGAVSIMPVRVLNDFQEGSLSDVYTGIRYAAGLDSEASATPSRPANVINLSLGGPLSLDTASKEVFDALAEELGERNIAVVAASGNAAPGESARDFIDIPASAPGILAVGSVDATKARSTFSSYGPLLDFVAPGGFDGSTRILSAMYGPNPGSGDDYGELAGTSMAAPYVAGVLGLMYALVPDLEVEAAYRILAETSEDLGPAGRDEEYGWGLVNADRALRRLLMQPYGKYALDGSILQYEFGPISTLSSRSSSAGQSEKSAYPREVEGVYFVVLEKAIAARLGAPATASEIAHIAHSTGALNHENLGGGVWRFRMPTTLAKDEAVERLSASPLVKRVFPDRHISVAGDSGRRSVAYEILESGSQSGTSKPGAELYSTESSLREANWFSRFGPESQARIADLLADGNTIVALFAGERPTGGFGIEINEVAGRRQTLYLDYQVTEPAPGTLVTQALTSPFAVIRVTGRYNRLETRDLNEPKELQD